MDNPEHMERRRFPRAPIVAEIICSEKPREMQKGTGMLCFLSTDISAGGIFLETSLPLKIGTLIHLKFTIPGIFKTIITQARVVRINEDDPDSPLGMGIELEHLSYDDQKLIDDYVENRRND